MRFKSVFWLFNIVVAAALISITVASVIILEDRSAVMFWRGMWIPLALFLVLISSLDIYFMSNWKLFSFLEREDWPALLAWLEHRLYSRGRLNRPHASLLINTALSVSNLEAVRKLEMEIRRRKPELVHSLGVSLGIPVLLKQDPKAISDYFGPLADNPRTRRRDWAQWCRATAKGEEGIEELLVLMDSKDLSIKLLSTQILDRYTHRLTAEQMSALEGVKSELSASLKGPAAERLIRRSREDHLMALVLSSRVDEIIEGMKVPR